ncbi:MAG: IS982 family transposase [Chloroflexota bacterium]|jgi:hypothetical protein
MINTFDDFCLWMYVTVDDMWQTISAYFSRPGPQPLCSDSELLTMVLVGECRGWDVETEMLSHWRERRDLFPRQPSQSRFNRRRRQLSDALRLMRQRLLQQLDLAMEQLCALDSHPLPVVSFHHASRATGEWKVYQADYGWSASRQSNFYGFRLHLLVTLEGLILDYVLAPASVHDLPIARELLANRHGLTVLGDKAYIDKTVAAELRAQQHIDLLTLPRRNQRVQLPKAFHRPFKAARFIIETVNSQLSEQFNIQRNHAHTFWGLTARLHAKLTAHTLCVYLNRLLDKPMFLQIKALAFPN